ncbi:hypothetical protein CAEBREN_17552 [Caenorhabditis brenneri]|uniref:Uncharacterized protein n=1 Tax=Caenorhabditis brenneri TaxID=135651 RepID=G0NMD8_CAEBE|nr:hypothetical protein CAEBREN_17552 [Caenorhabditis brenneri]
MGSFDWIEIRNTCPEFILTDWDFVLAGFAFVGIFASFLLILKFRGTMKGTVFLSQLAGCDLGWCLLYMWNYFYTTIAVHYRSDFMALLRVFTLSETKIIKDFFEILFTLLIFHIIVEKFLWTCESRTRQKWIIYTVGPLKFFLAYITALYAVMASLVLNWNDLKYTDVPFCEIVIPHRVVQQPVLGFFQVTFIPWSQGIVTLLTFFIAMLTLCRLPGVRQDDPPLQINSEGRTRRLSNGKIKSTILCILFVYFTFMVRGTCYYMFLNPSHLYKAPMITRNLRSWSYDFMLVVFACSRMFIYYVFCRNEMVVEYPPNGLRY